MERNVHDPIDDFMMRMSGVRSRDAKLDRYLEKLMPEITQHGFAHARIDDIVRSMDISKATFYKYFSSKEDVIERVVDLLVDYFGQATTSISDASASYIQRFQDIYRQAVAIASYLSDSFLLDLKQIYPALWERVKQVQQKRQQQLQCYYEQGVQAGVFQDINPVLIILQDELILRNLIDPAFRMEHDLTLRTLLYDYYSLQKHQWFVPTVGQEIDDEPIKLYVDSMARKIALGMHHLHASGEN